MIDSYFRKMARDLNENCNFSIGYLVCDIPRDIIRVKKRSKPDGKEYVDQRQGEENSEDKEVPSMGEMST